jgi:tRNA(fMet)-specific endonuclease VapC
VAVLEARLAAVVVIPYDIEVCRTYAKLKNEAKTATGTDRVVGANDLWIAACAIRHGLPLVSNNRKHFEGLPGIRLISQDLSSH